MRRGSLIRMFITGSVVRLPRDEELDALIQQQSAEVDANARKEVISQINQMFYDKVYWVGLWQDPDVWAVGPRLTNVKFSGVTPFFYIAEWDIAE